MDLALTTKKEEVSTSIELVKDGKPTPALVALGIAEIAFDVLIARTAFRAFKFFHK